MNRVEVGAMKWDLDLWYELRGEAREGTGSGPDAAALDKIEDEPLEGI